VRFRPLIYLLAAGLLLASPAAAGAWSHQQHILITRLAARRILDDPAAPAGLKRVLRAVLHDGAGKPLTREDCQHLALQEYVGPEAAGYLAGLDGACTLPDRIQESEKGRSLLSPYHATESKMHYLDLEYFSDATGLPPHPDVSILPRPEAIPRDPADRRFATAGYLPHRTAECYRTLVGGFRREAPENDARTVEALGYLAHYLEDACQPHHATADYRSLSYLAGQVASVREVPATLPSGGVLRTYRADRDINPHGDIEFQLFENTDEPRRTFRATYWADLTRRIDGEPAIAAPALAASYDPFARSLELLFDSYRHLPAVGRAAQTGYATGVFDPAAFFSSEWSEGEEKKTIVHLVAARNAAAVLEVERALRAAWSDAHPPAPEHP
jgi:hypothetical protein